MRKLLLAVGMVMAVTIAGYSGTSASASATCDLNCEGGTITCTVSSGTCSGSTSSGSVTCCGQTHTCAAFNNWYVCYFECIHGFPPPGAKDVTPNIKMNAVPDIKQNCIPGCGTAPQTNFSC
jgi:hypothetical protein